MNTTDRIWCVYNHTPGGNMVATHFETYSLRKRMGGDQTQDITFTAESQMEGLRKSSFVCLNQNDIVTKNKVLAYTGTKSVSQDPRAAMIVLDWAKEQGVRPIQPVQSTKGVGEQANDRVDKLERLISAQQVKIDQLLGIVSELKETKTDTPPPPPTIPGEVENEKKKDI